MALGKTQAQGDVGDLIWQTTGVCKRQRKSGFLSCSMRKLGLKTSPSPSAASPVQHWMLSAGNSPSSAVTCPVPQFVDPSSAISLDSHSGTPPRPAASGSAASLCVTYLHLNSCTRSRRHRSSFSSRSRSPNTHSSCFLRLQMKFSNTGSKFLRDAGSTYCCSSSHLVVSTLFCCSSSRTWAGKRWESQDLSCPGASALPKGKNENQIRIAKGQVLLSQGVEWDQHLFGAKLVPPSTRISG